jgi:hypothetical protein
MTTTQSQTRSNVRQEIASRLAAIGLVCTDGVLLFLSGKLLFSASDLVNFLGYRHVTYLDLRNMTDEVVIPERDPATVLIFQKASSTGKAVRRRRQDPWLERRVGFRSIVAPQMAVDERVWFWSFESDSSMAGGAASEYIPEKALLRRTAKS